MTKSRMSEAWTQSEDALFRRIPLYSPLFSPGESFCFLYSVTKNYTRGRNMSYTAKTSSDFPPETLIFPVQLSPGKIGYLVLEVKQTYILVSLPRLWFESMHFSLSICQTTFKSLPWKIQWLQPRATSGPHQMWILRIHTTNCSSVCFPRQ